MTANSIFTNPSKTYEHKETSKYAILNPRNQTFKRFVKGRNYKVGTGFIWVHKESDEYVKTILTSKTTYKEFLKEVLIQEKYMQIVALQWVPVRILSKRKLAVLECDDETECIPLKPCVMPGCLCRETGVGCF